MTASFMGHGPFYSDSIRIAVIAMERMCRLGSITPTQWMKQAVEEDISVTPLLEATERAVKSVQ